MFSISRPHATRDDSGHSESVRFHASDHDFQAAQLNQHARPMPSPFFQQVIWS
jgi:hypothetical protein